MDPNPISGWTARNRLGIRRECVSFAGCSAPNCGTAAHTNTFDDTNAQPDFCGRISDFANVHAPADIYTSTFLGNAYFYESRQPFFRTRHNNVGGHSPGFDRHRWDRLYFIQTPIGLESTS
jgi:hypothetical protein